ncbi:hypothetical protein E2C01_007681 [Portunus trituberculatus]|uniref:Uncharacterized protein n=1 Tax=Portunus trituberculatus TaxID=210409 RepID=A0A5B7D4N9_PORTR|nr:hypothetical protein [Portunus trituberculatus]
MAPSEGEQTRSSMSATLISFQSVATEHCFVVTDTTVTIAVLWAENEANTAGNGSDGGGNSASDSRINGRF